VADLIRADVGRARAVECRDPNLDEWGTMCTRPPGHDGDHENKRTRAVWATLTSR